MCNWMLWGTPVIPVLGQEELKIDNSLDYIETLSPKQ
jgi:hypothetical protein